MGAVLSSQRCVARSSRTGEPCKKWAVRGATVCATHGGSTRHIRAKAAERVALAEAAARGKRSPWDALEDVHATSDVLFARARTEFDRGDLTAETAGQLIEAMERLGRWSEKLIASGHAERATRIAEIQGADLVRVIGKILHRLGDQLDLTAEQRAAAARVAAEELRAQGRTAIEGGESA
jgi:hypothetical protein